MFDCYKFKEPLLSFSPRTEYDFFNIGDNRLLFQIYAGGISPTPTLIPFGTFDDGIVEDVEGLVVYVEILESELDDRDRGEVTLERSAYLLRITPSCMLNDLKLISVQYYSLCVLMIVCT